MLLQVLNYSFLGYLIIRMKPILLSTAILLSIITHSQSGSNCTSAIPLAIDGISNTYSMSGTTGTSYSTCNYSGVGEVLFFSFTTDNNASCIEIEITTETAVEADVSVYSQCSPDISFDSLALCLNDGNGIWSSRQSVGAGDVLRANFTYYLRIWTAPGYADKITVTAKVSTQNNYTCQTATTISNIPIWQTNACAVPNAQVNAIDLCAQSIENTAWYKFTFTNPDDNVINISAVNCDNFMPQEEVGYQSGLFEGNCNNLIFKDCHSDPGGNYLFQLGIPPFTPLGTVFYVVVDGMFDANCKFMIWAGTTPLLGSRWGRLSAEPLSNGQRIKWSTLAEENVVRFEIERSLDKINFQKIGSVQAVGTSVRENFYNYFDPVSYSQSYYRIKMVRSDNSYGYSNIIAVKRSGKEVLITKTQNSIRVNSAKATDVMIYTMSGQLMKRFKGADIFIPTSDWAPGVYIIKTPETSEKYIRQ